MLLGVGLDQRPIPLATRPVAVDSELAESVIHHGEFLALDHANDARKRTGFGCPPPIVAAFRRDFRCPGHCHDPPSSFPYFFRTADSPLDNWRRRLRCCLAHLRSSKTQGRELQKRIFAILFLAPGSGFFQFFTSHGFLLSLHVTVPARGLPACPFATTAPDPASPRHCVPHGGGTPHPRPHPGRHTLCPDGWCDALRSA